MFKKLNLVDLLTIRNRKASNMLSYTLYFETFEASFFIAIKIYIFFWKRLITIHKLDGSQSTYLWIEIFVTT